MCLEPHQPHSKCPRSPSQAPESIPPHKTRPDSPIRTLQRNCDPSQIWPRGSFVHRFQERDVFLIYRPLLAPFRLRAPAALGGIQATGGGGGAVLGRSQASAPPTRCQAGSAPEAPPPSRRWNSGCCRVTADHSEGVCLWPVGLSLTSLASAPGGHRGLSQPVLFKSLGLCLPLHIRELSGYCQSNIKLDSLLSPAASDDNGTREHSGSTDTLPVTVRTLLMD